MVLTAIGSDLTHCQRMEYTMPAYKYQVALSPAQRKQLQALCGRGEISARKLARARILLLADQNRRQGAMDDHQIHEVLDVSQTTISRVRKSLPPVD